MEAAIQLEIRDTQDLGRTLNRKIRICFLANAENMHTVKWVNHLSGKGHEIHVLSFEPGPSLSKNVRLHRIGPDIHRNLRYFVAARQVRNLVKEIRPEVVHAHYASGYGTLGRLIGFRPYILSVWGSDVFDVPLQSALHRGLISANLASADHICSTSRVMARQTLKYCRKPITITPFGVDCSQFAPFTRPQNSAEFVVGTVKALEPQYGIEFLIRGFALFSKRFTGKAVRLVIAGKGRLQKSLQKLARDLGISELTEFMGAIPHERVPEVLSRFSVFAALSESESFGVAVIEASACGLPVVVTNVGGLPEVVQAGTTGIIIPPRDLAAAAAAFSTLMEDPDLRRRLGTAGRAFVLQEYQWSQNAMRMEQLYDSILR